MLTLTCEAASATTKPITDACTALADASCTAENECLCGGGYGPNSGGTACVGGNVEVSENVLPFSKSGGIQRKRSL